MTMALWAVRLHSNAFNELEDDTFSVESGTQPAAVKKAILLANDYAADNGYNPDTNPNWELVFANKIFDGVEDNGHSDGNKASVVQLRKGISKEHFVVGAAKTVTRAGLIAWLTKPFEDFNQKCQALIYQLCKAFGSVPAVYPTAIAARDASTIVSTDMNSAPLGAIGYATLGTAGHVMISLGGGLWAMGSAYAHTWFSEKDHTGYSTWAQYHAATGAGAIGWSHTNGKNTITVVPDAVTSPSAAQRQVGKVNANQRTAALVSSPSAANIAGSPLLAGAIITPKGFVHGTAPSGTTNNVWIVTADGHYVWSGDFTNTATTGLTDLTIYTVTFNSEGGNVIASETAQAGKTVTLPLAPTRTGFTFKGWFDAITGGAAFTAATPIAASVTVYAQWAAIVAPPTPVLISVSFNTQGGSTVPPEAIAAGAPALAPAAPVLAGSTFNGWFTAPSGGLQWDFSAPIAASTTLYAQWTETPVVTNPSGAPQWVVNFIAAFTAFLSKYFGSK